VEIEWNNFNISCSLHEDLTFSAVCLPKDFDPKRLADCAIEWNLRQQQGLNPATIFIANALINSSIEGWFGSWPPVNKLIVQCIITPRTQ
jgi:hypothetical protein